RDRADALVVAPDTFFISRRGQFATLAARHGLPAAHSTREEVEAGGLMSYGSDPPAMWRQVGVYARHDLEGPNPAARQVVLAAKCDTAICLVRARAGGPQVSTTLLAGADEVIE